MLIFISSENMGSFDVTHPWVTLEHRAPITLCYFEQHAGKVWHYNQPITTQTCSSWMLPPHQAPQTSHNHRLEYVERS